MPKIPRLLAVSDRRLLGGDWESWCARLLALGVEGLQLREKDLEDRDLLELARRVRAAFPRPRVLLLNRRFDIALAAGADGVHLPADGLPTARVRAAVPPGFLLGRSTHALPEIREAAREGADYVVFGPIHSTPSKLGRIEPRGVSSLAAAAACGVPVIAIGGLDASRAREALAAGAHGIAAIRAFATESGSRALAEAVLGGSEKR